MSMLLRIQTRSVGCSFSTPGAGMGMARTAATSGALPSRSASQSAGSLPCVRSTAFAARAKNSSTIASGFARTALEYRS